MAAGHTNEELKQQALKVMAEGRAETSATLYWAREQLSPRRAFHRLVAVHPVIATCIACGVGAMIPLVFHRNHPASAGRSRHQPEPKKPDPPASSGGIAGIVARAAIPPLIKSALAPTLALLLAHLQRRGRAPVDPDMP